MIKDLVMVEWIDPETGSKVLSLGWLSHDGPTSRRWSPIATQMGRTFSLQYSSPAMQSCRC